MLCLLTRLRNMWRALRHTSSQPYGLYIIIWTAVILCGIVRVVVGRRPMSIVRVVVGQPLP